MSSATVESPVASSQLFFDWSEQADVGVAPLQARRSSFARPVGKGQPSAKEPTASQPAQVAHGDSAQFPITNSARTQGQANSSQASCLSFTRDARIEKPVRIGAVMIKLLKRYGITDQEIAEGVANYARKHQQALAS